MELYLLDARGERIGIVSEYNTLTWRTSLVSARADVSLPLSMEGLLRDAAYLERDDSDVLAVIYGQTANHGENTLSLEACDPIELLKRRVNFWTRNYNSQRREAIVVDLVNAALSNVRDLPSANRMIPLWQRMTDTQSVSRYLNERLTTQISWEDCYSEVCSLLEGIPLRLCTRFSNGVITPHLYEGVDRSAAVVFSVADGDLSDLVHARIDEGVCDTAVIGGEGEHASRLVTTARLERGITHGELWVDASDIGNQDADGRQIPRAQVIAALQERGEAELREQPYENSLTGAVSEERFVFGTDYFVGDLVGFKTSFAEACDVITEVEEVFAGGAKTVNIAIGKTYPTIREIIEKRRP